VFISLASAEARSRFRLPRYAMRITKGLIFIDPSVAAPSPPEVRRSNRSRRSRRPVPIRYLEDSNPAAAAT